MRGPTLEEIRSGTSVIPIVSDGVGLGVLRAVEPADAEDLATWRDANRQWFITEFPMDPGRTEEWIAQLVARSDRLLLMVQLTDGGSVGHVGLASIDRVAGSAAIDNLLKGRATPSVRGLMAAAISSLTAWAAATLGLQRFWLQVFEDNPAVGFYRSLGFVVEGSGSPMRFHGQSGDGSWEPAEEPGERVLLTMRLPKEPPVLLAESS
jgi:RimJ/RimL family protein N-acetyltransferase